MVIIAAGMVRTPSCGVKELAERNVVKEYGRQDEQEGLHGAYRIRCNGGSRIAGRTGIKTVLIKDNDRCISVGDLEKNVDDKKKDRTAFGEAKGSD